MNLFYLKRHEMKLSCSEQTNTQPASALQIPDGVSVILPQTALISLSALPPLII